MLFYSLWHPWFLIRNQPSFVSLSSAYNVSYFFQPFLVFAFSLVSSNVTVTRWSVVFFVFFLEYICPFLIYGIPYICWDPWIYKLRLFSKIGKVLVIISSSIILLPHSLSPLPPGFQSHPRRPLGIIPQSHQGSVNFFQYYFPGFQIRWFLFISSIQALTLFSTISDPLLISSGEF